MSKDKLTKYDLSDRLLDFGVAVIRYMENLKKSYVEIHIGKQLLRSGTSCGANYEEACGAESKADFLHKLRICLKELRESRYWLKLSDKAGIGDKKRLAQMLIEVNELIKIIAKSIATSMGRR